MRGRDWYRDWCRERRELEEGLPSGGGLQDARIERVWTDSRGRLHLALSFGPGGLEEPEEGDSQVPRPARPPLVPNGPGSPIAGS